MCDSDRSLGLARVTTAWDDTARRPRPGRLTGEEVFETLEVGMAVSEELAEEPQAGNQLCSRGIECGDWPRQVDQDVSRQTRVGMQAKSNEDSIIRSRVTPVLTATNNE